MLQNILIGFSIFNYNSSKKNFIKPNDIQLVFLDIFDSIKYIKDYFYVVSLKGRLSIACINPKYTKRVSATRNPVL